MPNIVHIIINIGAVVTAAIAAWYWLKSSRLRLGEVSASISDAPELYIYEVQSALIESARLNKRAALWTGASVVFNVFTSF